MGRELGKSDRFNTAAQAFHVTLVDEKVGMQVAILNDLGIKVSVLFSHELDGPSRLACTHLLDDRVEMARHFRLLVHVLSRLH